MNFTDKRDNAGHEKTTVNKLVLSIRGAHMRFCRFCHAMSHMAREKNYTKACSAAYHRISKHAKGNNVSYLIELSF